MEKIKLGIFGAGRGIELLKNFLLQDVEVVALCENHTARREAAMKKLDKSVVAYEKFDDFINHPMDAVLMANNFHEHARYAIRCFEKNIHVFCECISNGTMGEGVELVRAFEKSKSVYMIAENYPQMLFNREMKRVADSGKLGKILFAEGEYNHPVNKWDTNFNKRYNFYPKHWRNFLPKTYYVTHSLGPLMNITGATPKRVTAFSIYSPSSEAVPNASHVADASSSMMTFNDDGSVFRFTACSSYGAHHNSYRVCGTKGQIENLRGMGQQVMLRYNEWDKPEGEECNQLYTPSWNDKDEELIKTSGHGGGDYLTVRMFLDCVRENKQPPFPFDVYSATVMSSVGILAHRSVLEGGKPYDIPDFRKEEDRKLYENDYETPFWGEDGSAPTMPCCTNPDYKPTELQMELYLKELQK